MEPSRDMIDLPLTTAELMQANPTYAATRFLCCECGTPTTWNASSMCHNCLKSRVDISEGITTSVMLQRCRACGRYLDAPKMWKSCELESRELLSICLKRIKGMNKVKITVQKEVYTGVLLQQNVAAKQEWLVVVQCRQRAENKRTFYLLEQLILKHKAHKRTLNVKEVPDGIDFYFANLKHATKFSAFVTSVIPSRRKAGGDRVMSQDLKNNVAKMKQAIPIEIIPLCKDDIFCLHPKQHNNLGCIGPLVVVVSVGPNLRVMDWQRMEIHDFRSEVYFRQPRYALQTIKNAIEYIVIDCHPTGLAVGQFLQAEVTLAKASDLGSNDIQVTCLSHLGAILQAGDTVLGYDLSNAVFNDNELQDWPKLVLPEVFIVKKVGVPFISSSCLMEPSGSAHEEEEDVETQGADQGGGTRVPAPPVSCDVGRQEEGVYQSRLKSSRDDYEMFLNDIESDPTVRRQEGTRRSAAVLTPPTAAT
ncbi:hypothetical protein GUITHDRAFT_101481 [Guillardia theta CCMP2712]|uniref:60S ribosomal export protein NMD3 n=1 Tax=Guillardia theta (strain CCMP2712) TaxID=905079 RepID=L1JY57_GUITC|nr:hypothetical protein GUITHDRAFT_101481 [Guillardia theta CCMP2712]EKX53038.1 hypothetical protein GUITHDRAFT_101481 [Guillardia theta CCMP2712]|eukprot:XP_005840018.1 hypothetical protein GUITHDRAFT_101481 [Guillardia theta CCMP2712]